MDEHGTVFSKNTLAVLAKCVEGTYSASDYNRYVRAPFEALTDRLIPFMYAADTKFLLNPYMSTIISGMKSNAMSGFKDCLKATFRRNKEAYPRYPFFQFQLTPFYFGLRLDCSYLSREMMDILRSEAIGRSRIFNEAWAAYNAQDYFKMEGISYQGSRFRAYDQDIQNFLEHRSLSFQAYDRDLQKLLRDDFILCITEAYRTMLPFFRLLLFAAEREGNYLFDPAVFDPDNIRQPAE